MIKFPQVYINIICGNIIIKTEGRIGERYKMTNRFTEKAERIIENSLIYASELGHNYIGSEHLLLALVSERDCAASKLLEIKGANTAETKNIICRFSGTGDKTTLGKDSMTPRLKKILQASAYISSNCRHRFIGSEHLLYALVSERGCIGVKILEALGIDTESLLSEIEDFMSENGAVGANENVHDDSVSHIYRPKEKRKEKSSIAGAPTISQYGRDLCALAKDGRLDPIIGRDTETERLIAILSRRTKNNPCLIGDPGVGKTAVAEGLAERIVNGNVPDTLAGKLIVLLDIPSMVAGAKYRGEFEERLKNVMSEAAKNPDIILFIDEMHTLIGAGSAEGAVDAANILKPALARGEIRVIGATTAEEYRRHIERDAALERRFQSVNVKEPTPEDTVAILSGLRDKYEAHHKLRISDSAINAAVRLSVRYIPDRFLPDKAIDLLDEAAANLRISSQAPNDEMRSLDAELRQTLIEKEAAILAQDFEAAALLRDKERKTQKKFVEARKKHDIELSSGSLTLSEDDIAAVLTSWTGIPVSRLKETESRRLIELEDALKQRVIGQNEAVEAVSKAIKRGRVGLKEAARPIGSFIFLGPTGVGKTELSRALADVMFGSESSMIRLDMSEYMESHSASKLIGAPPGYVGYNDGGQLTEKLRRNPYSVVLFDEIEKAHPDVMNLLLQILDDGRLTDSLGRQVDFSNAIIIMTSNIGADAMIRGTVLGFGSDIGDDSDKSHLRAAVFENLKRSFKPEFLNRVDEIIIFNRLSLNSIEEIAQITLKKLSERASSIGISLSFDTDVSNFIAKQGFDRNYGARPIKRAVVRFVEDAFSEAVLKGEFSSGDSVFAYTSDEKIIFEKR